MAHGRIFRQWIAKALGLTLIAATLIPLASSPALADFRGGGHFGGRPFFRDRDDHFFFRDRDDRFFFRDRRFFFRNRFFFRDPRFFVTPRPIVVYP